MKQALRSDIALTFDRKRARFNLTLLGQTVQQNVCEFLLTSSFLLGQNPEEYVLSTDSRYDEVRVPLTIDGKSVIADLPDFLRLRDIYSHQLYLLKLEDVLLHRGIRFAD